MPSVVVAAVDEAPYAYACAAAYPFQDPSCRLGSELGLVLEVLGSIGLRPSVRVFPEWEAMVESLAAGEADVVGLTDSDIAWSDYVDDVDFVLFPVSVEKVLLVYHDSADLRLSDAHTKSSIFPKVMPSFFWSLLLCALVVGILRLGLGERRASWASFGFFLSLELLSQVFGAATVQNLNFPRPHRPLFGSLDELAALLLRGEWGLAISGSESSLDDIIRGDGGHDDPFERLVFPKDVAYANTSWARGLRAATEKRRPLVTDGLASMVTALLDGPRIGLLYENDVEPLQKLGCDFHVVDIDALPRSNFYHVHRKGLDEDLEKVLRTLGAMPLLKALTHQQAQKLFTTLPWDLCARKDPSNHGPAPISAGQYASSVGLPARLLLLSAVAVGGEVAFARASVAYRRSGTFVTRL